MNTPKLLDLFCGAGGAGEGYRRAGFEVTGVDIQSQKHYRAGRFIQANALDYVTQYGWMYDAIHASPPCQAYSVTRSIHGRDYPALVELTRFWLETIGAPYVIENVVGAPLRNPIMLCGTTFGLKVYRHRLFESNTFLLGIPHYPHRDNTPSAGHREYGVNGISAKGYISVCGHIGNTKYARAAMGIDWMSRDELAQAIPSAYTEYIGRQLMRAVLYRRERDCA